MSDTKHGVFGFIGGHPALDFVNTASKRQGGELKERLGSYSDWLEWVRQAGQIDAARADELLAIAHDQPRTAAAALRRVRLLREAAFRLFGCLIESHEPDAQDLALLNRHACRGPRNNVVGWNGQRFLKGGPKPASPLDEPLAQVTGGLVDLLCGEDSSAVSLCADPECSWLFLDRSPARRRRWCSMADCGNRAKARRHYHKLKARKG